ncbi:hypothetical protein GCM10009021_07000 [Halarchaeum nitratireducens]|uniref:Uncharacterized protein n=1 Tax=Halarchaeum nitratireducens TaxID=489913 RepID=A0A830G8X6_9EURY|nr:hypothetical protein GCM10009021_07000 [Halarchaeum nitratireducens]
MIGLERGDHLVKRVRAVGGSSAVVSILDRGPLGTPSETADLEWRRHDGATARTVVRRPIALPHSLSVSVTALVESAREHFDERDDPIAPYTGSTRRCRKSYTVATTIGSQIGVCGTTHHAIVTL